MIMNSPTVPFGHVNAPSRDELIRTLRLVQHATAPTQNDGAYHENAHDLVSEVLAKVDAHAAYMAQHFPEHKP